MTDPKDQIAKDQQELDQLQAEIDEVRSHTPEEQMRRERHFLDGGTVGSEVEDNTIAPG